MRFLVVLLAVAAALPALAAERIGLAAVVRGDVTAVAENGTATPLKSKDPVYANQTLKTGPDGQAQLIFNDETVFSIGNDTQIVLDRFVYNPDTGLGESIVNVVKGTFRFITGKIAKKTPENVKVKTPFATIGVRGSGGIGSVGPNGEATVGLVVCCLQVTNAAGTVDLTTPNFFTSVSAPDTPPTPPVRFTEAQLSELNGALGGSPKKTDSPPEPEGAGPTKQDGPAPKKDDSGPRGPGSGPEGRQQGNAAPRPAPTLAAGPAPLGLPPVNLSNATQDTTAGGVDTVFGKFGLLNAGGALANSVYGGVSGRPLTGGSFSLLFTAANSGFGVAAGNTERAILPGGAGAGAFTVAPFLFADEFYFGRGYRNAAGTFHYYDLTNSATSENLALFFGTPMAASSILTSGPVGFFHFLPSSLEDEPLLNFGFPPGFLADGANPGGSGVGAIVDFNRNFFLAADMEIANMTGDYNYRFTVALGKIERGANPGFVGSVFDYAASRDGGMVDPPLTTNGTFESTAFFGQNGYIDGFTLNLDLLEGNAFTGQTAFNSFTAGVVAPPPAPPTTERSLADTLGLRSNTNQKGFSTGFLTRNVNTTPDVRRLNVLNQNDVEFDPNSGANTVGMEITYDDMDDTPTYNVEFGQQIPGTPNVYISNYVYAMEVGGISGATNFEGMAVSEIVDRPLCGMCRFSNWGVWAGRSETPGPQVNVFNLIPYVVGPIAQIGNMPTTGTATYAGSTFGAVHNTATGDIRHHYGTMNAQFTFGSGPSASLNSFSATLGPYEFSMSSGGSISGSPGAPAVFNTSLQGANAFSTDLTGSVNGALVGNSSAFTNGNSEIIGQFNFNHAASTSQGLGVFQGVQQ